MPPVNYVFIPNKIVRAHFDEVGDYDPGCKLKNEYESKPKPVSQGLGIAEQIDGSGGVKVDQRNEWIGVECE